MSDDPSRVISGSRVKVGKDSAVIGLPHLHERIAEAAKPVEPPKPAEPIVKLNRDGDVIRSIEVTCTCGERIVINCVY
jgi:hypothetical protein